MSLSWLDNLKSKFESNDHNQDHGSGRRFSIMKKHNTENKDGHASPSSTRKVEAIQKKEAKEITSSPSTESKHNRLSVSQSSIGKKEHVSHKKSSSHSRTPSLSFSTTSGAISEKKEKESTSPLPKTQSADLPSPNYASPTSSTSMYQVPVYSSGNKKAAPGRKHLQSSSNDEAFRAVVADHLRPEAGEEAEDEEALMGRIKRSVSFGRENRNSRGTSLPPVHLKKLSLTDPRTAEQPSQIPSHTKEHLSNDQSHDPASHGKSNNSEKRSGQHDDEARKRLIERDKVWQEVQLLRQEELRLQSYVRDLQQSALQAEEENKESNRLIQVLKNEITALTSTKTYLQQDIEKLNLKKERTRKEIEELFDPQYFEPGARQNHRSKQRAKRTSHDSTGSPRPSSTSPPLSPARSPRPTRASPHSSQRNSQTQLAKSPSIARIMAPSRLSTHEEDPEEQRDGEEEAYQNAATKALSSSPQAEGEATSITDPNIPLSRKIGFW